MLHDLIRTGEITGRDAAAVVENYRKGINKGLYKIISKMGISTIASYRGAQLFEIVGLHDEVVKLLLQGHGSAAFRARASPIWKPNRSGWLNTPGSGGKPIDAWRSAQIHARRRIPRLQPGRGDALQKAVQQRRLRRLSRSTPALVNERPVATLRDLLPAQAPGPPIPLDEVEPIEAILPRFDSAGMSLGALSPEAHEALAMAMNRLGGRSNSGEGGEDPARYGTEKSSKIKQVASGRFGVTPDYLVNAEVLQIKIAQGAKPGEGGQLPGDKVNAMIARLRYLQARRGADFAAAAPRHLFHRRPGAADFRPQAGQSAGAGVGQAGGRSRASAPSPPAWPRPMPT